MSNNIYYITNGTEYYGRDGTQEIRSVSYIPKYFSKKKTADEFFKSNKEALGIQNYRVEVDIVYFINPNQAPSGYTLTDGCHYIGLTHSKKPFISKSPRFAYFNKNTTILKQYLTVMTTHEERNKWHFERAEDYIVKHNLNYPINNETNSDEKNDPSNTKQKRIPVTPLERK